MQVVYLLLSLEDSVVSNGVAPTQGESRTNLRARVFLLFLLSLRTLFFLHLALIVNDYWRRHTVSKYIRRLGGAKTHFIVDDDVCGIARE